MSVDPPAAKPRGEVFKAPAHMPKGRRKKWWGAVVQIDWKDLIAFVGAVCTSLALRPDLENHEKWGIAVDATIEFLDSEIEFTGILGKILDFVDAPILHGIAAVVVPLVYHGHVKKP